MPAPETFAYPILLGAIYGASRIGRRRPISFDDGFEWVRACSLAMLFGLLIVVEVRLVIAGRVTTMMGFAAGILGIASAFSMLGISVLELLAARGGQEASTRAVRS